MFVDLLKVRALSISECELGAGRALVLARSEIAGERSKTGLPTAPDDMSSFDPNINAYAIRSKPPSPRANITTPTGHGSIPKPN